MMPGQHVAGAGRGQPRVAGGHDERVARRASATTVAGPFSSTTHLQLGGQAPRRGEAVGRRAACRTSSPYSPSWGVSTVGRGAGRAARRRRRRTTTPARTARRRRPPPAARRSATTSRRAGGRASAAAEPGPDDEGVEPVEVARARPATTADDGSVPPHHLGRRQRVVGRRRATTGARSRRRPAARRGPTRWAAPVMPGEPATTHTAARHLCESAGRPGSHRATSSRSTRWAVAERRRRGRCRPPPPRRPGVLPGANSSPGLSAANVTVRVGAAARPRPASPVSAVDAARDVDGEHRGGADGRARVQVPRKPVP